MKRLAVFLGWLACLFCGQVAAQNVPSSSTDPTALSAAADLRTIPIGKGLPVLVQVGLFFQDVRSLDENEGTFAATVDMRLRWQDLRLRYPAGQSASGFQEYRGPQALDKLKEIWAPGVVLANLKGEPTYQVTNIRIFPTGSVELMQRTEAQFNTKIDPGDFPFDSQVLGVEATLRKETNGEASLIFLQADIDFSSAAPTISIDGWQPRLVNIKRSLQAGWYGTVHSGVIIGLEIVRQPTSAIMAIFVPLFATLLIPLLAIWMNYTDRGKFEIEAFELANMIVGGLFAVIALNFTVNSEYKSIATGDNTATRFFALNYVALALSLAVVVLFYRFNFLLRWFGRYVQEQAFEYLLWSVPLLAMGCGLAFLLVAYV